MLHMKVCINNYMNGNVCINNYMNGLTFYKFKILGVVPTQHEVELSQRELAVENDKIFVNFLIN